jgi:superfamily II DNA/RNA helicase
VARDRNLAAFAAGTSRVLVATDVAARGVHVDDIELVIHVDPPAEHKAYLHRSGRTARAGKEGEVVTLVLPEQRKDTALLLRKAAITVTPQRVTADSDAVRALVGEVAEYVKPVPRAAEPVRGQSQGGRSQGANAQRKRAGRDGAGAGRSDAGRSDAGRSDAGRSDQPRRERAPRAEGAAPRQGGAGRGGRSGGAGGGSAAGAQQGGGKLQVGGLVRMSQGGAARRGR